MTLCLAILTFQDDERLIPLVVEQRGILNKSLAMQNICKLFPLIRNNVLRSGRKGLVDQKNPIRLRNYGSVVLNDRHSLRLFQGHYRNILDNAATLVAISEHSKSPFECHCTLEKLEHIVIQCYSNRSNKRDSKLPTYTRLEKMHGELLMLLKRLLLEYDDVHSSNFLSTRGGGLLELNLSTENELGIREFLPRHEKEHVTLRMLEMFGRKYSFQRAIILIKIMATIPRMTSSRLISLTNFQSELHYPWISTSHLKEFSKHLHNSRGISPDS